MTTYTFPAITPSETTLELVSNTKSFMSPFTGAIQTVDRGGERWVMKLAFRSLSGTNRATMMAFLAKLNGQQHRVTVFNHAEDNQGAFGGTPLVSGGSQTGTSIDVDGCSTGITDWIKAGDYFSVNGELKICTADASSDGSGDITIAFAPRLRSAPSDNAPLTTTAGTGTFILADESVSWSHRPGGFSDFAVSLIEDIA